MNGDGKDDIVGFGTPGVYVALASGGGNFSDGFLALSAFGGPPVGPAKIITRAISPTSIMTAEPTSSVSGRARFSCLWDKPMAPSPEPQPTLWLSARARRLD
jgi:hypothetical protein